MKINCQREKRKTTKVWHHQKQERGASDKERMWTHWNYGEKLGEDRIDLDIKAKVNPR